MIKMLEYETANPGQDEDDTEARASRPNVSFAPEESQSPPNGHTGGTMGPHDKDDSDRSAINSRPQSIRSALGQPQMSALRGGMTLPTYPPVEGAANYEARNTRFAGSFDAAPDAEAGRILPRSAGYV